MYRELRTGNVQMLSLACPQAALSLVALSRLCLAAGGCRSILLPLETLFLVCKMEPRMPLPLGLDS